MIYFVKKKISGAVFVFLDEVLWAFVRLFQELLHMREIRLFPHHGEENRLQAREACWE